MKLDKDTVSDLIATMIETNAITYWAEFYDVRREEKMVRYTSFSVKDGGFENEPHIASPVTINAESILAARDKLVNGKVDVSRDIKAQFVGEPQDWDYDIEGADVLVQIALFGEIIYG